MLISLAIVAYSFFFGLDKFPMIVGNSLPGDCRNASVHDSSTFDNQDQAVSLTITALITDQTDSFDSGISKESHPALDSFRCRVLGSNLRVRG